ncbi:MFS transporter [Bacillus kwashiorkori]|uniref:MFS transporter n=1 Tax=Bacillus kwashiorkori TaxID=1522318 RepID=UPI0007844F24|nr:MFS transporter [Bacillus kwashiorkori]
MKGLNFRFWILVVIVSISGFSQGMLLPLIAVLLENANVPSHINGLHATGLYIGVLLASPLMEAPLKKFGYKPLIVFGGLAVIISLFSFTLTDSLLVWFFLRLLIGIGDHALHFSTQTWITAFSPIHKRGRNISLYGLFFGVGFAVGPLMTRFIAIDPELPFIISSIFSLLAWLTVFFLKNEIPEAAASDVETYSLRSTFSRFTQVFKFAWAAVLPAFCYGILEASLNGNFPVYALRIGMDVDALSIILPAFSVGGIIFQLPLGLLSDRYGRRNILLFIMFFGAASFISAAIFEQSFVLLTLTFFIAGMLLGSTFSLSIAYMTDLLPKQLLPAGNLMIGIFFSIGSIIGPFLGGIFIQYLQQISFFYFISIMLFFIFIGLLLFKIQKSVDHSFNI